MVSIALAACGDSVPGNSVASVDGDNITREQFTHWLGIAASTSQPQGSDKVAYNPPQYTACVANKKKNAPKPAKGQPQQTDAQFRTQCKQEYEGLRDQVMQFLILEKWVNGEAEDQGVKVSAAEADKEFNEAKKQSFPQEKDFQEFLKQSGMTVNDAKFQVRFNTVYTKLREKAVKGATKVSDKAVADFYEKNKARFATPATRDLRVVLTKTEDKANEAKQQSLKEATPAIKQQLDAQNKQKADDEFNTALRKKWKERTNCADAFVMSQCKNAPKPKTNTAAPGQPQQPDPAQR